MKSLENLFDRWMPYIEKISNNKYLQAISRGMMGTLTITIVGSLAVLLIVFPIEAVKNFISSSGLVSVLMAINNFTIGMLAIYVVFLIAKNLAEEFLPNEDGSRFGLIALMCFLILTPLTLTEEQSMVLSFDWLGAQGVFTAMFTSIFVARIMVLFHEKQWTVKLPETVPPMVRNSFSSLLPGILLAIFLVLFV